VSGFARRFTPLSGKRYLATLDVPYGVTMPRRFAPLPDRGRLHERITRELALIIIQAAGREEPFSFPNENDLSQQLGVSRTVVRESMKVLADKGLIVMRPRSGTHARPRSEWNMLDPDILAWQAELRPDARFLWELCEVRLAIEPTAAGFAAVRATPEELQAIERCLQSREELGTNSGFSQIIDLDLQFQAAVVAACHNTLLAHLSAIIRGPLRAALLHTSRLQASVALELEAHRKLVDALRRKNPIAAHKAAERAVGLAMVAVEEVLQLKEPRTPR
jgi:GntR family transcriptional regulator, galactonate operon transcriptional repressor